MMVTNLLQLGQGRKNREEETLEFVHIPTYQFQYGQCSRDPPSLKFKFIWLEAPCQIDFCFWAKEFLLKNQGSFRFARHEPESPPLLASSVLT